MLNCLRTGDPVNPILLFIHGWPDTAQIWDKQLQYFEKDYFCVAPNLTNFGEKEDVQLNFHDLKTKLASTLQETLGNSSHEQVNLIGHDWGALFGYLLQRENPQLVKKMVTIDVGANFRMENWRQFLGIPLYQFWLITAFWIGKVAPFIGNWLTRAMVVMMRAPRQMPSHSEINYLYWYFWREFLQTGRFAGIDGKYELNCALLYLYGKEKPFHLHTKDWIDLVNSRADSEAIGLDTDHWVMVRDPAQTNAAIEQFLLTGVPVCPST